jgi:hypothetical protein
VPRGTSAAARGRDGAEAVGFFGGVPAGIDVGSTRGVDFALLPNVELVTAFRLLMVFVVLPVFVVFVVFGAFWAFARLAVFARFETVARLAPALGVARFATLDLARPRALVRREPDDALAGRRRVEGFRVAMRAPVPRGVIKRPQIGTAFKTGGGTPDRAFVLDSVQLAPDCGGTG